MKKDILELAIYFCFISPWFMRDLNGVYKFIGSISFLVLSLCIASFLTNNIWGNTRGVAMLLEEKYIKN